MAPSEKPSRNRRAALRRPPKQSTRVVCYKGSIGLGRNIALSLLDISESGARLVLSAALKKKQDVLVEITSVNSVRPIKMSATVVWSMPTADGNHCVGLQFNKLLNYSELLQMTLPTEKSKQPNKK